MRLILCIIAAIILLNSYSQNEIDSLLNVLEHEIDNAEKYGQIKEEKLKAIKKLKLTAKTFENEFHINHQLIQEYAYYQFDSTLKYLDLNIQSAKKHNNNELMYESNLEMINSLTLNDRGTEAIDILSKLKREKLPERLLTDYYTAHFNIYERILEKKHNETNFVRYTDLKDSYFDSIVNSFTANPDKFNSLKEYEYLKRGEYKRALKLNDRRLKNVTPGESEYALIYFYRAGNYRLQNKNEGAKKFYAISAIANIRNAEKNNASLTELALIHYEEGKLEQASKFINFAMEDALFYNSPYRFIHLSKVLPLINEAYRLESGKQKKNLKTFGIISTALAILLLVAVSFILKQLITLSKARNEIRSNNSRLKELNEQLLNSNNNLKETNHIKEQYIANFLKICSDNIDKLDSFRKTVNKSIANRKFNELFETTKSKKMIDCELAEFYRNFDTTFLSIYPDFVEKLNNLLQPDESIMLKNDELLNTELRVFALIRLGIDDSAQIAELLRYSKQTIYNYRVKGRNKAKGNRDELEAMIMQIGATI